MKKPVISAVGAGRMGRGIAHVFAYAGYPVQLIDLKHRDQAARDALEQEALGEIRESLEMLSGLGLFDGAAIATILSRITFVSREDAPLALANTDIVFEGVPEVLELKHEAFDFVSSHVSDKAIVTSTTSTILATTLSNMVTRPERFLNAHWLNPAYIVPLVELSPSDVTDPACVEQLKTILEDVGKVPVVCAPGPGYIVPRIQALAMNEAARIVEEGIATPEDIDKAVKYGFGFRFAILGLVEFIDWGGGDILYYASRYMTEATGSSRFESPAIVAENMEAGRIGMKSGEGFYNFKDRDIPAYRRETLGRFVDLLKHMDLARPPVL